MGVDSSGQHQDEEAPNTMKRSSKSSGEVVVGSKKKRTKSNKKIEKSKGRTDRTDGTVKKKKKKTKSRSKSEESLTAADDSSDSISRLGQEKQSYRQTSGPIERQISGSSTNTIGTTPSPIKTASTERRVAQEEEEEVPGRTPGAFRVYVSGRYESDDENDENISHQNEDEELPLAQVERIDHQQQQSNSTSAGNTNATTTVDESGQELFDNEGEQKYTRTNRHQDGHFWLIIAIIFALLIIGTIVATTVILKAAKKSDNTNTNDNSDSNEGFVVRGSDFFAQDYATLDASVGASLYAVQFGCDRQDCSPSGYGGGPPPPKVQMTCSGSNNIAVLDIREYKTEGSSLKYAQYLCETDQNTKTCTQYTDGVKQPTVIWIVACATDNEDPVGLTVESAYELGENGASSCQGSSSGGSSFMSHGIAIGSICFDSSTSSSPLITTVDTSVLECIKGLERTVGQTQMGSLDIGFCGQIALCQNTDGPCPIMEVESIQATATVPNQCVLTKQDPSSSFVDLLNIEEVWSEIEIYLEVRNFGAGTPDALLQAV